MMRRTVFEYLAVLALGAVIAGACCCAPHQDRFKAAEAEGTYYAQSNRLYDDDGDFDIRKKVVYDKVVAATFNSELQVSNKQLTTYRCTWCHECGFPQAWDIKNVGKPNWHPRYRGEGWEPIVYRMSLIEGSMLNEEIADRIYKYLRDESLGKYVEANDPKGAIVREAKPGQTSFEILSPTAAAKKREAEEKKRLEEQKRQAGGNGGTK
jgi:hypothetical protein